MNINIKKLIEKMYDSYSNILNKTDCIDLSEDIVTAINENSMFVTPLQEWLNGKKVFTDIQVNGFSLVNLAKRLNNINPNIPIAILILWLESKENVVYHGLAAVADYYCLANPRIILGEGCKYAIFTDEIWHFMLDNQDSIELKEYQAWQILLLNPTLILQVAYEHPNNTALVLQNDGSYLIVTFEGGE